MWCLSGDLLQKLKLHINRNTRKHSSRMRTARLLTVVSREGVHGVCVQGVCVSRDVCVSRRCTSPRPKRHPRDPEARTPAPNQIHRHIPLWTNRMTHASKTSTSRAANVHTYWWICLYLSQIYLDYVEDVSLDLCIDCSFETNKLVMSYQLPHRLHIFLASKMMQ